MAQAGGWAVLTVESWPKGVTAGRPFTVQYVLRQHGNHLLSGVEIEALIAFLNAKEG